MEYNRYNCAVTTRRDPEPPVRRLRQSGGTWTRRQQSAPRYTPPARSQTYI